MTAATQPLIFAATLSNLLTLGWRGPSANAAAEPAEIETQDVSAALSLSESARRIGATRLLLARLNWDRLFSSANPPGAETPVVAKARLTRQAMKDAAGRRAKTARDRERAFQQLIRACS